MLGHSRAAESSPAAAGLLAHPSIEVSVRQGRAPDLLAEGFPPGTEVFVTFLPGQDWRETVAMSARLRGAGFVPVPHVAVRGLESTRSAAALLNACVADAGVDRILAIAGDADRPAGPFAQVLDLIDSGLLEASGLTCIALAGHPEGHPRVDGDLLDRAMVEKVERATRRGLAPRIVTQFCFEAEPILAYLGRLDRLGIAVPVRIGIAGPADLKTLTTFAARCGVGNSLRALRRSGGLFGRLFGYRGPDRLLADLARGLAGRLDHDPNNGPAGDAPAHMPGHMVEGVHVFPFGGIARAADWLAGARR